MHRTKTWWVLALTVAISGLWACQSPANERQSQSTTQTTQTTQEQAVIADPRTYKKLDDATLKATLSPLAWKVTQEDATEPPFRNAYWDNHDDGLYVDSTSGEPLFSSRDKFDSGTGWPSFTKPVDPQRVTEKRDFSHGMMRVEVRSKAGDAHLGHLFPDGPAPTGMRYCMNSASLRFIPTAKLQAEGYGAYLPLFGGKATEIADSGSGMCAADAPGGPGCASSFTTLVVAATLTPAQVNKVKAVDGVFEVTATPKGVEVVFDPTVTSVDAVRAAAN
jgi:peptide methionine sulfoxide reductase msrA/msrB